MIDRHDRGFRFYFTFVFKQTTVSDYDEVTIGPILLQ